MSLESDLYAWFLTQAGLTALIGARLYPVLLKQGSALPAVVFTRIDTPAESVTQEGHELLRPRFQFDCWAETHAGAIALELQVCAALRAFRLTGQRSVFIENRHDLSEPDTGMYRRVVDAIIYYED